MITAHFVATTRIEAAPPPAASRGWLHRLRTDFFATPASGVATMVLAALLLALAGKLLDWGVLHAVFSTGGQGP